MKLILHTLLLAAGTASAAFAEPFWQSTHYDAGHYGAYPYQQYGSFDLVSPRLNILTWDDQCEYGLTLLTPRGGSVPTPGPMMLDGRGNLIWMDKKWGDTENLRIQRYRGEDYLTFWAGVDDGTHGRGYYYMLDSTYEIRHIVKPAGKLKGDLHEFVITPEGTALMTIYETIPWDLKDMGVKREPGYIVDSLFQEVDIASGKKIFQWRASDHFPASETLAPIENSGWQESNPFDFFHINSVSKDRNGNYWISSRYMCAILCISREDGSVRHRLSGVSTDFLDLSDGAATNFTWQHHMTYHTSPNSPEQDYVTIFDNADYNWNPTPAIESRALKLRLDLSPALGDRPTAEVLRAYKNPLPLLSHSQGSVQVLSPLRLHKQTGAAKRRHNETIFVGWGHSGAYTQYDGPTGRVLCDVHFGAYSTFDFGWAKSYRTFKHLGAWIGEPLTRPDIGMSKPDDAAAAAKSRVYASWNGATEIVSWQLQGARRFLGGADNVGERGWEDVGKPVPKEGFEVEFDLGLLAASLNHVKRHEDARGHADAATLPYTYYRVLALGSKTRRGTTKGRQKGKGKGKGKGRHRGAPVLGVSRTLNHHTGTVLDALPRSGGDASSGGGTGKLAVEATLRDEDGKALMLVLLACVLTGAGLAWWEVRAWLRRRRRRREQNALQAQRPSEMRDAAAAAGDDVETQALLSEPAPGPAGSREAA